ncbi:MAG: hypothetical protein COT85_03045 [Chlamydiae bacterium CG10_big_fil_rev_8_21_14_0_10_42_34]|nr:MAG: hypothetical protein COT85_03045 [Chlamydiae bacterium CG10_big_fil_rev_8_21_14_0_10_42_34]
MSEEIGATLAFGVIAILLLIMGFRRGFFSLDGKLWEVPIRFVHLIGAFAIYFLASYLTTTLAVTLFKKQIMLHYVAYSSWLNFLVSFCIFLFLAIYMSFLPRWVAKGILRREGESHTFSDNIWAALYAWILAFPLVLFLSQVLELVIYKIFKVTQLPDQIAVKFLKSTFDNPVYFTLAVISIIVLAPLIEETLFRGFLQTFIRKHLGSKQAIVITSFCFSLFHYSAGQGLGNISIIVSLFVLSLFIGFLYEKQGSLFAPMVLHGSFNAVSVVNLYLFGGFTTGL